MNQILTVEDIHADFRSALDVHDVPMMPEKEVDMDKKKLMENLGFTNSKSYEVVDKKSTIYNASINELREIQAKMPQYRMIGLKGIIDLCNKYDFFIGAVENYVEEVPKENLLEIKQYYEDVKNANISLCSDDIFDQLLCVENRAITRSTGRRLHIIAPRSYFDKNLRAINRILVVEKKPRFQLKLHAPKFSDPIAIQFLYTKNSEHIVAHIPSAWDIGSDDEAVTTKVKVTHQENN